MTNLSKHPKSIEIEQNLSTTVGALSALHALLIPEKDLHLVNREDMCCLVDSILAPLRRAYEEVTAPRKEEAHFVSIGNPFPENSDEIICTTRDLARVLGRTHGNVMDTVRKRMACYSDEFKKQNFLPDFYTYQHSTGPRKAPIFKITRNGFWAFLMMPQTMATKHEIAFRQQLVSGAVTVETLFRGEK